MDMNEVWLYFERQNPSLRQALTESWLLYLSKQMQLRYHDSLQVHLIEGIDCPWSIFYNKAALWPELTKLTLLSMTSLSLLRSSSAVSQFCMRISDPSFPQRAFKVFLSSLPGTCVQTNINITNLTRLHIGTRIIVSPNPWKCRFKMRTYKHTIKVQILCSTRVVSTLILKFCIFVQCVQHFWFNLQTKKQTNRKLFTFM